MMRGLRHSLAHRLSAALLFVSLLLAAGTAGADGRGSTIHAHFQVELNGASTLTVTEDQAATVTARVRCTAHCTSITGFSELPRRNSAYFTVSATAPASGGGVTLNANPQARYNTLPTTNINLGTTNTGATLTIDGNPAMDGRRTVTVNAEGYYATQLPGQAYGSWFQSRYDIAPIVASATLTILDDDTRLTVTESGGSTVVTEDGGTDTFTVRLPTNPQAAVAVDVSSQDGDECEVSLDGGMTYLAAGVGGPLTFLPDGSDPSDLLSAQTSLWNTPQTVTVRGVDDMVSDVGATCAVRLDPSSSDAQYAMAIARTTVLVTNTDNDGTGEVTEVLLPEVARAMADSRATAVRQRLERADLGGAPTSPSPSLTENLNLERLMRHGSAMQEDEELDWKRHLLPQAAFALSLDDDEGMGSDIVLWGGGDYRDLDGEARGVKWDGDVTSAHLGADRLLPNGLRVGLAATWSEAKLDYGHQGQKGKWELEMTSAQPYLGWTSPGGISLWAMAGVGSGDLEVVTGGQRQKSDADMRMASAGARGPLYAANGTEVSLRGEAMYADFEVDDNGDSIQRQKSDATRLRVAVEARQEKILASGARLLPRFELGMRYDGGDGETGSGAEVGVGVDYGSGRLGLTAGARTLVANSDYDEWGANVSLVYRAMTDGRGLHITLTPTWGTAESGLQRLWKAGTALYEEDEEDPDSSLKLDGEIGYGRHHVGGLLTPYLGMSVRDEGRHYRLGGRFKLRETLTLNTECERLEQDRADTEHGIGVTVEYRW